MSLGAAVCSLFSCSLITSLLPFIIFSTGCSFVNGRLDLLLFTVSSDRDFPLSEDLCFVPFSLFRRDELRCMRDFSREEFLRKLGRFTDSALALSPDAAIK